MFLNHKKEGVMSINIGLKLWSTNHHYLQEAVRLHHNARYQYIELFSVPGSFATHADKWIELKQSLGITFIIHAPHFVQGMNLAKAECAENNMKLAREALQFADALDAQHVIFHPGFDGDDTQTAHQLKLINDPRIIIENKPYRASIHAPLKLSREHVCNGYSPEVITQIRIESGVGFCLDIGHAICSANDQGFDQLDYIKKFMELKPTMFHLTDGDWAGVDDQHPHLGTANFKLKEIVSLLPADCMLTLETVHDFDDSLADFEHDVAYLRALEKQRNDAVYFVPARHADMRNVFDLANDESVRANSINQDSIIWHDHVVWFENKLNDDRAYLYVIKDVNNQAIGYVRFDKKQPEDAYFISIALAPEVRGKGLGTLVISRASWLICQMAGLSTIYAYIKQDNIPSLKSFAKAQYAFVEEKMIGDCWYHVSKFEYQKAAAEIEKGME